MATGEKRIADRLRWVACKPDCIGAGSSSAPLALASYNEKFLRLYFTTPSTNGSYSVEPIYVKTTMAGAGGVGGRSQFHTYSNVASGGWVNGLKGYMEFGSSGRTTGLASGICAELKMPNATVSSGGYAPLEVEYVAGGTSTATAGSLSGVHAAFIWMQASGDSDGDFDDNGFLFSIKGLTAGADHLLSLTSQTLRLGVGTTTRYLVLSQSQDGLGLGNSTTAQSYTAGTPPVALYFTNAGTSGSTNAEPFYLKSILTGTGQVGGRARFHTYTNVTVGGWVNALKGYMEFGSSGKNTGLASAICAEMLMPNANMGSGGVYFPLEVEYVAGGTSLVTAGSLTGNHAGFIYMAASGDADGDFDDNGYLFHITGLTSGSGHLFYANKSVPFDAYLKIGVGTATYYIGLLAQQGAAT